MFAPLQSPALSQRSSCEDDEESSDESGSEDSEDHGLQAGIEELNDPAGIDEAEDTAPASHIEHIQLTQAFIEEIKRATIDNDKLDDEVKHRLRHPAEDVIDLSSDPDLRFSLDLYMSCANASEATYNSIRDSIKRRFPDMDILSHYQAKKKISEITGVVSVSDDMCVNSCHAFTGPYADRDTCATCSEPRYTIVNPGMPSEKRVPRKQMCTIPLGPQIQALRRSVHGANSMRYREQKIKQFCDSFLDLEDDLDAIYDDIFCGSDILDLCEALDSTSDDTTVIFSLDGAQLYKNKKSDTWIAIWIITNYDPKTRYRSKHVLPAAIVPGPEKPKNIDSFLFRTFHHLSAIQREDNGAGIKVYDAIKKEVVSSRTCLLCATADAVGLTDLDGRVGHHGRHGCRKGCPFQGRHKPSSGHYYSAHLKPNNYSIPDCNQPDFDFRNLQHQLSPDDYNRLLRIVMESQNQGEYERNRKNTGISKPSILSGLLASHTLMLPLCFTLDLMHLWFNLAELLLALFRGTILCEATDSRLSWDWAPFMSDNIWKSHGKLVASATKFFPSFFHRPPRNPAEKISSGYKATEYHLYVFGLGPGFFRQVLPKKYWRNFCKLVRGVRILTQRAITGKQAQEAHSYLVQFVEEYENIYCQRRVDRLHFARPCVHSLVHVGLELYRVGNGIHTDQFTMERAIGEYGKNIRQPSNMFGALNQIALRKAEINALKSICPELDNDLTSKFPRHSYDIGDGHLLLRPREEMAHAFSAAEIRAIQCVCNADKRQKWGRLQLPSGHVARSVYSENRRQSENKRNTRNVKVQKYTVTIIHSVLNIA